MRRPEGTRCPGPVSGVSAAREGRGVGSVDGCGAHEVQVWPVGPVDVDKGGVEGPFVEQRPQRFVSVDGSLNVSDVAQTVQLSGHSSSGRVVGLDEEDPVAARRTRWWLCPSWWSVPGVRARGPDGNRRLRCVFGRDGVRWRRRAR